MSLTTTDVERVLEALGLEFEVRNNEANSFCPMHEKLTGKSDNNPSWWINLDSGMHLCFSCGYKGNVLQLVCDVKGFFTGKTETRDYPRAEDWLRAIGEVTVEKLETALSNMPKYVREKRMVPISDAHLAIYDPVPDEVLNERNINRESATFYGVLWNSNKQRYILPLRDAQHATLIGWQIKGLDRFFRNYPAGVAKSKTLFGLDKHTGDECIIVESPLDCLRLRTAGFEGALATCGAIMSEEQFRIIRSMKKITVAFDNPRVDEAGLKACQDIRKKAVRDGIMVHFFNYGTSTAKDVGDMTDKEIEYGVRHALSSVRGDASFLPQ